MTILWDALDRLDEGRKWGKGSGNKDGKRCILGAIGNSDTGDYISCVIHTLGGMDAAEVVADVVRSQFPDRLMPHPDITCISICRQFNDDPDTEWNDVSLVLEKAAIRQDEVLW